MRESTSKPKISVAIATYNGAAYVGEQLESIRVQSCQPDEVIVSDDGSKDETANIVRQFAATAPFPVRLLQREGKLGILENFYAAFAGCSGEVIVYCDQDDVWRPEKLEMQMAAMAKGAVLVMHPSEIVDEALTPFGRSEPYNPVAGYLKEPVDVYPVRGFGHQMAFRRPVLEMMARLREVAERLAVTDLPRNFDRYIPFCAVLVGSIVILKEPLTLFRRHASASSGAGLPEIDEGTLSARSEAAIAREQRETVDLQAIVREAEASGILESAAGARYDAALTRKMARLEAQAAVVQARSGMARGLALVGALSASLRPTGFSNDRRTHAAKISLAAALKGRG